jgi:hypothetical protein
MAQHISFEAEKTWRSIPKSHQEIILNNIWCGQCRGGTTIVDYQPQMMGNTLVLIGKCQTCGNEVRRVID